MHGEWGSRIKPSVFSGDDVVRSTSRCATPGCIMPVICVSVWFSAICVSPNFAKFPKVYVLQCTSTVLASLAGSFFQTRLRKDLKIVADIQANKNRDAMNHLEHPG